MAQIDDLTNGLNSLKVDIAAKMKVLNDELSAQATQIANSQPVDLTNAISLVTDMRASLGDPAPDQSQGSSPPSDSGTSNPPSDPSQQPTS